MIDLRSDREKVESWLRVCLKTKERWLEQGSHGNLFFSEQLCVLNEYIEQGRCWLENHLSE